MNKKQKRFLILLIELLITIIVVFIAYYFIKTTFINSFNRGESFFEKEDLPYTEAQITINEGDSVMDFCEKLERSGIISNANGFYIESSLMGNVRDILPGTYLLNSRMSSYQIFLDASTSTENTDPNEISITIKEGYTLSDIGKYLEAQDLVEYNEFMDVANNYYFDYPFLEEIRERDNYLEGYLFPDTYRIYKYASTEDIINKMLSRFSEVYNEQIAYMMKDTDRSLDEIITIASIIEKEVRVPNERATVSSVIYNRLNQNINLEMCSTILYALDKRKEHLTNEDLKVDSPYNTYTNSGLPVGPISNPGLECIKAAIYPDGSDALFFVVDNEELGSHYFTNDYNDFLAAKERYNQKY